MFTPIYMGTDHMLGQDNYVPLTTNNFEIRVYPLATEVTSGTEFIRLLTEATDSIGAIAEQQDTITVHYGNGFIKFPSKVMFEEVTWTLNCYCEPNVLGALRAWREQVKNSRDEKMGLPSQYMRQVYFINYDGQGNPRDVIKCSATWIGALNNGDMNQTGGEVVKVTVPLVISRVIYLKPEEFR